jgi:hypothetical protein
MIQTGHGRPLFAALVLISAVLCATPAAHAASRGNLIEVTVPTPRSDQVVLARVEVTMRGGGRLAVRRAGRVPAGFGVGAVRAGQRGDTVLVRLAAVRRRASARAGRSLRIRLRVGTARHTYGRVRTQTVPIGPATSVRRTRDCATINGEAARWTVVPGLATVRVDGRTFTARTAVGAAQQIACERRIRSVRDTQRFLVSVDRDFADGGGGIVEGFYATWARDANGAPRICVYVRGERGGEGDVTVASTTQRFALDRTRGLARVDTPVAGEGEYAFTVRWRQADGTYRSSESSLRIPASGPKGNDPPDPYAAAGNCG